MTVTLTWKKRYPKRDRPGVLALVRKIYPTAKDTSEGVLIRTRKGRDTRPMQLFLFFKCFAGIE